MDHILAKVKGERKNPFFKLISNRALFDAVSVDMDACVAYRPDHNLDEDAWFKIEQFSQQPFCLDFLKTNFDSKAYNNIQKQQFAKISWLLSIQNQDVYFQKITPSSFLCKKTLAFGDVIKIEEGQDRLVIHAEPDAMYVKAHDALVFRRLATLTSLFKGIERLYKAATQEEIEHFLQNAFIKLEGHYCADNVSTPNRKRIALAMDTLSTLAEKDKSAMLHYIHRYCTGKLTFNKQTQQFTIRGDNELKLLLYGIEQRFYTTEFSQEKRLANSVLAL